jgi:hypothetical protein
MDQTGHRSAQTIRNTQTAPANIVVPVIHLNLAFILHRDHPATTNHATSRPHLLVEFQTDSTDLRRIPGQLKEQTPFQSLVVLLIQVPAPIHYLNTHFHPILSAVTSGKPSAHHTKFQYKSTNRK